ncbi:MAG: type 3 dihydrofolate reductase [Candidatus Promineifilaceae bacterium]
MLISLIAALDRNRVIGREGAMPWRLPADLRRFKKITLGKPLIMGRKTHQAIGRPLSGRLNIVLTRSRSFTTPGCVVVHSLEQALAAAGGAAEVIGIGGGEVYRHMLPLAGRIYLTFVEGEFEGDATFPAWDPAEWRAIEQESVPADAQNAYATEFVVLERHAG